MQNSEYEILGMSREDFEARNALGYRAWGEGGIRDPVEILHQILAGLDYPEALIRAAAEARMERIRRGLFAVAPKNLELLAKLRASGIRTALLSNADVIDTWYWEESPLAPHFDAAVFSWQAGTLKPEPPIYALALERLAPDPVLCPEPLSPGACLYVGDGGHGELPGARAAGFSTVLTVEYIKDLWPERIAALSAGADQVIQDITDLQALCGL
jgi:putative hydrolase of the HAD superfamily